jgi:IS5 family transposase
MKKSFKDTKNTNRKKKKSQRKYKITNWSAYNKALMQRGSITLWISDDISSWWYGTGKNTYSDRAIETMLTIQAVYELPLRATVGFVRSLFAQVGILLEIPDYTTLSRRAQHIAITLKKNRKSASDLILDSTGAKVYGEGEWKARKHGWSKRRTWKKLHIGIDGDGEIRAVAVTENDIHDAEVVSDILAQEDGQITDFYGDGAYDAFHVYESLKDHGVTGFHIPPQKNAKIHQHGNTKALPHPRDENLRSIRKTSREQWKQISGYHTRSLGESVMFRYKTIFGERLCFHNEKSQANEVLIKCNILNRYQTLGMPDTVAIG